MSKSDDLLRIAKQQLKIQDLISLKYRQSGQWLNYNECPFCESKGHFRVNLKTNLFCTFNLCANGRQVGSVVDFIMITEHLNLNDAIKRVLDLSGFGDRAKKTSHEIKKINEKIQNEKIKELINETTYNLIFHYWTNEEIKLKILIDETKTDNDFILKLYKAISETTQMFIEYNKENFKKIKYIEQIISLQLKYTLKNEEILKREEINKLF